MRLTAVALSLVLCLAAAGCGGKKSGSGSGSGDLAVQSPSERSGETLQIYGFGKGDDVASNRAAVAKAAIAPAKLQNPEGGFDPQRFLTQLASGTVPDLIYVDRQMIATLAAKGALMPLESCVADQQIDLSQYRQPALDEATYDGKLYALPEFTNQRALIVNKKVLAASGLSLSDVSTTDWDKLRAVAKKLATTSGGKLTRIGFDPKLPEFFIMWAHANGAELLSKDGRTVDFTDPKVVEALTYTVSLMDEQGGWSKFKAYRDTFDYFGSKNPVASNQIGFWPMESWYWNVMSDTSPQVKAAAVPFTDRSGKPFTYISGSGWAIPAQAKNPALACTWMKAITSVKAWMNAATKRIAARKSAGEPFTGLYTANAVADQKILALVPKGSDQWSQAVHTLAQVQKNAVYWPASPAGARIQQALLDAVQRVLDGQQSAKASLAQAQKQAQRALDSVPATS
jgi:multiple sugar transport system substrate-binding protein